MIKRSESIHVVTPKICDIMKEATARNGRNGLIKENGKTKKIKIVVTTPEAPIKNGSNNCETFIDPKKISAGIRTIARKTKLDNPKFLNF